MDGDIVSTGGNSSTYSWVTSFDRTQNNAVMVCGLEYITLSEPFACEDTIVMDVQYTPQMGVVVTGDGSPSGQVIEGDSFLAECAVVDSNPEAENSTWFDANGDVVGTGEWLEFNTVHRNQTDDTYTCMSSVSFYDGSQGSGSIMFIISVHYIPKVEGDEVLCKERDDITLHCEVDANPEPHTYIWTKDGLRLSDQQSYTIQTTDRDHAGDYICAATNQLYDGSEGKGQAIIKLEVQYLSTIDMIVSPSTEVEDGQDVRIHCVANGNPDPHVMRLIRDTDKILAEEGGNKLQYDMRGINRSQSGTFSCGATTRFYDGSEDVSEEKQHIIVQSHFQITYKLTSSSC